jgi:2-oxo-4-hydroxy-4-carboxy-5-ureidoimidazoline decarboxylase
MTLEQFNSLNPKEARDNLLRCCGCTRWANELITKMPFGSLEELKNVSENIWNSCDEGDWLEAFSHHPKIGHTPDKKHESTAEWASAEQSEVQSAAEKVKKELADGNSHYEKKFGYIYIVCATGKSAEEMLGILKQRLTNDPQKEIRIAAAEQNKITNIRIDKLLS